MLLRLGRTPSEAVPKREEQYEGRLLFLSLSERREVASFAIVMLFGFVGI